MIRHFIVCFLVFDRHSLPTLYTKINDMSIAEIDNYHLIKDGCLCSVTFCRKSDIGVFIDEMRKVYNVETISKEDYTPIVIIKPRKAG